MQIAICDDEKETRDTLAIKIKNLYPKAEILLYKSGEELLLSDIHPDILLLDIQMPDKNGMETAKQFRSNNKNKHTILIFLTALEDYVFQAFDVGAFHYLVKPFDDKKFEEVLINAVKQYNDSKTENADTKNLCITVNAGRKHTVVKLEDIVYAEVFNRKIMLHTVDADIEYYGKMKELEKKLGYGFYRTHRAFLINFNFIKKYDATTIYFENGQALMAKQNYHDFVKSYMRYNQREWRER